MSISEQKARQLFERLAALLRERAAGTVVDQVIDEIAQGKQVIYKTVRRRNQTGDLYQPEGEEAGSDRGGRREYAETLQYSPLDRLNLLLQALERAVVDAGTLDAELLKIYPKVRFVPEQEEENIRTFDIGTLAEHSKELEELRSHIAALRALIEA